MNEADLRAVAASLDDYASMTPDERAEVDERAYVNHAKYLLDEVHKLRAEIARKDEVWREVAAERSEFLDQFSKEKAREAARIALEHMRTITLDHGEYAILELGYVHEDMVAEIREHVPDDIRGRIMIVDGQVHRLTPEEAA